MNIFDIKTGIYSHLLLSAIAFALVVIAWVSFDFPSIGIDDANIMLSYAENIAQGRGFTYANNGMPVEGSTSLLWTFLCALSFYLEMNEFGVQAMSIILVLASIFVWLTVLEHCCRPRFVVCLFMLILLLSTPGYIIWMSFTCMDIALWGLFVAAITYDLIAA